MAFNAMKSFHRDHNKLLWSVRRYSKQSVYREDEANKSRYTRDEEGPKPRIIHGQEYPEWRKPWNQRKGEYVGFLRTLQLDGNPKSDLLNVMSKIPHLNWKMLKDWWQYVLLNHELDNQRFISQRVEILGFNLAAAHFFLYRKCSIRWKGDSNWVKGYSVQENTNVKLPTKFEDGYTVEAIDASTFLRGQLRYEGLENLYGLNFLKWLSVRNNSFIDEWCIDRIAGQNGTTLEYLDISGCQLSVGAIIALSRMPALRLLVITEPGENKEIELALAALEEVNTNLIIKYEPKVVPAAKLNNM